MTFIKGGLSYDEQLSVLKKNAQQSVRLTSLRRGLAVSIFINVILLAVVLFTIGEKVISAHTIETKEG